MTIDEEASLEAQLVRASISNLVDMCESYMFLFKSKTVAAKLWNTATAAARKITLEPAIILVAIMTGVQNGVKVQTNLQLWKVCGGQEEANLKQIQCTCRYPSFE